MAMVLAFEDAKPNSHKLNGGSDGSVLGDGTNTKFFDHRDNPDLPQASLNQHGEGYFNTTHFHTVDQFQVVVEGEGKLGRHELSPFGIHFTYAYTPYGPLSSNPGHGLTFFVMRPHRDKGPQRLPQAREQLMQIQNRHPGQITRHVTFSSALPSIVPESDVMLREVPGMKSDRGLAAYTLSMGPNARTLAPDPSHGDGQYLVIVQGSLLYREQEHKALGLVFVFPKEGPFEIQTGAEGLSALVLNFPQRSN